MLLYSAHQDIEKIAIYWSMFPVEEKQETNLSQTILVENEALR